jgi:hypothetical protein
MLWYHPVSEKNPLAQTLAQLTFIPTKTAQSM